MEHSEWAELNRDYGISKPNAIGFMFRTALYYIVLVFDKTFAWNANSNTTETIHAIRLCTQCHIS